MVSTRRSRSAGGDSEALTNVHQASQEEVSSSKQAAGKQTQAPPLAPISEAEPFPSDDKPQTQTPRRTRVQSKQQQQHQPDEEEQQQPQQEQQQQQEEEPSAQAPPTQDINTHISDDDDDTDDLELDFDGPGVLQNLAAAIRSGFHSQSQQHKQQQQQPRAPHPAAAAAAGGGRKELDDAALQQLRWRPSTGLQLPAGAAAAVALATTTTTAQQRPRQKKRSQQQQQQQHEDDDQPLLGALVNAPPAAAAADGAGSSIQKQQRQRQHSTAGLPSAAAAAVGKPAGLSKALHAPTLDAAARTKAAKQSAPDTAGSKWFDLPAPKITDELKRDLRVLRLRGAYDPKRFYKSFDNTKFPKYFAIGTVVDDPLDNNRLSAGQRRATLTEQLLVDPELTVSRKRRFNKLQEDAQKWSKHKKRKTGQPRKNPTKHRPKH